LARAISISSNIGKNQQRLELLEKETALNDRSIEILKRDQELKSEQIFNRNLIIITLIGCIVAILAAGFMIYKNIQARRKADKLLALRSLAGQMNPHFIFNALNSVNEFVAARDELAANRYLTSFSRLMRQVLDDSRKTLITLGEELEMLGHYLKLEHARFSDKFDYDLQVAPELRDSELMIPPMMIQPYLENAVWHGLRYKSSKGQLRIVLSVQDDMLEIRIEDNGIGVIKSRELKTRNQKRQYSVGMKNTETRINLLNEIYGTRISVTIHELQPDAEEPGTIVCLRAPLALEQLVNHE
jgi:LytS/YehU family sensor histidine kinase